MSADDHPLDDQTRRGRAIADSRATTAEREARARTLAHALRVQAALKQAEEAAQRPPRADVEVVERAFARVERPPTADQQQSAAEEARRQAIYRANIEHGYREWAPLVRDDGGEPA